MNDPDTARAPLLALLGHQFKEPALLDEALTHPSISGRQGRDYDRLEFVGDRVLGVIVADELLTRFPAADAGVLARRLNALVREEMLASLASGIGLDAHIRLARGERDTGGATKPAILADALEAVIGSLFRDGGLDVARRFVVALLGPHLDAVEGAAKDAKTVLQEWAAATGKQMPVYTVTGQDGPPHAPHFHVSVTVGNLSASGGGGSKRVAQQDAAGTLLRQAGVWT